MEGCEGGWRFFRSQCLHLIEYELGYGVHGLICNQMNKSERDHGGGRCNLYLSSKHKKSARKFSKILTVLATHV